jgi:hypothetical protein
MIEGYETLVVAVNPKTAEALSRSAARRNPDWRFNS